MKQPIPDNIQERFPRASTFDPEWVLNNEMGPNALWLLEALTSHLPLQENSAVLDMGCGRSMTSIYLAKELGLRVWATDLWVSADDNWQRVKEAGLQQQICPIRAEAHQLPFAAEFFDAIISIDSYQYYGTDDLYLGYLTRFLAPNGRIAVVVPGLTRPFVDGRPPAYWSEPQKSGATFWDPNECWCFHTLDFWQHRFGRLDYLELEVAETLKDGCQLWAAWERFRDGGGFSGFPSDAEVLERDNGEFLGFHLLVAKKTASHTDHSSLLRL